MHLIHREPKLLELKAKDDLESTILLAPSSGALDSVKCLIELCVQYTSTDLEGNGAIHLAALHFHTNTLEYFISWNNDEVPVWDLLVGMLKSDDVKRKHSAVKCLEVLSLALENNWKSILYAGGVPALVDLLRLENAELQFLQDLFCVTLEAMLRFEQRCQKLMLSLLLSAFCVHLWP